MKTMQAGQKVKVGTANIKVMSDPKDRNKPQLDAFGSTQHYGVVVNNSGGVYEAGWIPRIVLEKMAAAQLLEKEIAHAAYLKLKYLPGLEAEAAEEDYPRELLTAMTVPAKQLIIIVERILGRELTHDDILMDTSEACSVER